MMAATEYQGRERRIQVSLEDSQRIAGLVAEVEAIHRENAKRDLVIHDMAEDVKTLLALANQSRGGFWVGMSIASILGSVATFVATHLTFKIL
jgi:hypothetical protein